MEEMIARWIRETLRELEIAKSHQNLFRMHEMKILEVALRNLRDKLLK